jgi:hypothetical protein
MRKIICGVFAVIFLMLEAFCIFGFLTTFEPVENAMMYRVGYAVLGVACFPTAVLLFRFGFREK